MVSEPCATPTSWRQTQEVWSATASRFEPVAGVGRCELDPGLKAPPGATKFDSETKGFKQFFQLEPLFLSSHPYTGGDSGERLVANVEDARVSLDVLGVTTSDGRRIRLRKVRRCRLTSG